MDQQLRPTLFERLIALIVDFLILGIIGYISGMFFEDFYVSLGKYGTLIGSTITIVYFSVLQSKIGHGQTLGKLAIGAKVTDLKGEYLGIGKSFLRSLIVFFPIMNVEMFSSGNGMPIIVSLMVLAIFTSFYFIFVNKSRRCLHDILVSSIVIKKDVTEFEINEPNDRSTKKLIPIGIFAAVMFGVFLYQTFTENAFSQLLTLKQKIEARKEVISVNEINSNTTTSYLNDAPPRIYSSVKMTVRINDKQEASNVNSKYFDELYQIIKTEIPESQDMDGVTITLYYGYNIGIANKTQSVTRTFER
ncbi:MAG TPA: RDD family protein [Prolixibacteraceae bacterium]|jgi:uncharacterized RDD family membrane protein YckC